MINIDRLQLHLPAGFEHRAGHIGRLVGEHLRRLRATDDATIASLRVRGVEAKTSLDDYRIAERIARAVHSALPSRRR